MHSPNSYSFPFHFVLRESREGVGIGMATTTTTTTAAPARQLSQKEADIQMMLAAEVHLGTKNCDFQMERYIFKRRNDGMSVSLSLSLPFFFDLISHNICILRLMCEIFCRVMNV